MINVDSISKQPLEDVTKAILAILDAKGAGDGPKQAAMEALKAIVTPRPVTISHCTFTAKAGAK
jgi:hypothetical protein